MKKRIQTDNAPPASGPYSQAIIINNMVYTAGQLGLDPQTGNLVEGGIEGQAEQVLKNMSAVLEAAGTSTRNVVKTTVYLASMGDFAPMNAIYAKFFDPEAPPARTTIQAGALPRNALIEIECIAGLNDD